MIGAVVARVIAGCATWQGEALLRSTSSSRDARRMHRRTRWSTLVAVAIAAGAWACSSDVASTIGDAMVHAGEHLRDAASDDAGAQGGDRGALLDRADVRRRYDTAGIYWSETTTNWYAEIRLDAATAAASEVGGVLCGYERFGGANDGCDLAGMTCTGDVPPDELDCAPAYPTFEDGLVRVWCGSRTSATRSAEPTTPTVSGFRRATARIYAR